MGLIKEVFVVLFKVHIVFTTCIEEIGLLFLNSKQVIAILKQSI